MKKKYIAAALLMAAIGSGLTSCSDYLSVERFFGDRLSEERIFKDRDYSEEWLAQAYVYLAGENMDIAEKDHCLTNFADDMYYGDRGEEYGQFIDGSYDESRFQGSWLQSYAGIRQASIFIDNIDINEDFTPEEIKDMKAQARFLRAYMYWLLLRKYGPVPVLPEHAVDYDASYDDLSYPRNSYDECVEFISKEMLLAAQDLPTSRDLTNIARPTRGAALAVRAKAYLYAASPLMNGNTEMADFVDDKGRQLISQTYDNSKWAKAAAAALDVINLKDDDTGEPRYKLYTAGVRLEGSDPYPRTVPPPYNEKYSDKDYPNGWANIDPFESYRSLFNGDLYATENPELIFTRGQNNTDIQNMVRHQLPTSAGGYNCHGVTGKQCDAYETDKGEPFDRNTCLKGYVTADDVANNRYPQLREGVNLEYANREPRFYASVAFNGAFWACTSSTNTEYRNQQVWYYRGDSNGRNDSQLWLRTGIGMMKYVNPKDIQNNGGTIYPKIEPAIRYADILLMYAEALNECQGHYTVASWDGTATYDIYRDTKAMSQAISQVRIRAGVPDYAESVYNNPDDFRVKLKHERQIELFAENQRYYDLRRWKDAPTELIKQVYGCNTLMPVEQRDLFHTQVEVPSLRSTFSRKMYFWPISHDELQKNYRLTQAPGWTSYE